MDAFFPNEKKCAVILKKKEGYMTQASNIGEKINSSRLFRHNLDTDSLHDVITQHVKVKSCSEKG